MPIFTHLSDELVKPPYVLTDSMNESFVGAAGSY